MLLIACSRMLLRIPVSALSHRSRAGRSSNLVILSSTRSRPHRGRGQAFAEMTRLLPIADGVEGRIHKRASRPGGQQSRRASSRSCRFPATGSRTSLHAFAHGKSYVSTHSPTKPTENRLNERQPLGDNARQTKRKDLEARAWQRSSTDETWRNRSYAGAKACACGRAE
jgi:hypothetical protein